MKEHDDYDDNPNRPRDSRYGRGRRDGLGDGLDDYTAFRRTRSAGV